MASEPTLTPKQLPSDRHEVIAVLESIHVPWEEFDSSPRTHEVLIYKNTIPGADDIAARVRDASIIVCTICRLTAETLRQAPHLKCIISHAVGTDHINLAYCREANIQVMTCTNCNTESVAEHALSLYFATRRSLVSVHNALADFEPGRPNEWKSKGSLNGLMRDGTGAPPRTCAQETAGVVGYGAVGKQIARLCRALGMTILISQRKGGGGPAAPSSSLTNGDEQGGGGTAEPAPKPSLVPFSDVLAQSTVLFLALPLTPQSAGLISSRELGEMRPDAVVVNVSRGGIVDEDALVSALRSRAVFGYGTDVFAREPAGGGDDSPLLGDGARGLNLTLTGHLAWFSATTMSNQVRRVKESLGSFLDGEVGPDGIVVQRDFALDVRPSITAT